MLFLVAELKNLFCLTGRQNWVYVHITKPNLRCLCVATSTNINLTIQTVLCFGLKIKCINSKNKSTHMNMGHSTESVSNMNGSCWWADTQADISCTGSLNGQEEAPFE